MQPVKKFLLVFTLVFIIVNLQMSSYAQSKEDPVVINFSYAPEKIRQGDIWKLYLSVTDSEGKMHRVVFNVRIAGGNDAYKRTTVYLKKGMDKRFTGHFAMHTSSPAEIDDFVLEVSILDRAGNERKILYFPIEFDYKTEPMKPLPPDLEKDLNRLIGFIEPDWAQAG